MKNLRFPEKRTEMINKFLAWLDIEQNLKSIKEKEMELRRDLVSEYVQIDQGKDSITIIIDLKSGQYEFKVTANESTSIDKETLGIAEWTNLSPDVQDCFELEFKFSKSKYNKLTDEGKQEADVFLVTKPSAPTITHRLIR